MPLIMLAQHDQGGEAIGAALGALFSAIFSLFWACWCVIWIVGLLVFIFWIVMLIDCIQREEPAEFPKGQTKILWVLLLVLAGGIAVFFYYFMVYKKIPRAKSA